MSKTVSTLSIVEPEEKPAVELPAKSGEPDAPPADGGRDVHPVDRKAVRLEVGHDQPEEIDVAHAEDAGRDDEEGVALDGAEEEEREGHREVEDDEHDGDRRPAGLL